MTPKEINLIKNAAFTILAEATSPKYAKIVMAQTDAFTKLTFDDAVLLRIVNSSRWNKEHRCKRNDVRCAIGDELLARLKSTGNSRASIKIPRSLLPLFWDKYSICIEFPDGTDTLAQDSGYSLKQCMSLDDVKFTLN